MVQLRDNAQLPVLVLRVLHNLLQRVLLVRALVYHQVHLAESALADQLDPLVLVLLRRWANTSDSGRAGSRFSK